MLLNKSFIYLVILSCALFICCKSTYTKNYNTFSFYSNNDSLEIYIKDLIEVDTFQFANLEIKYNKGLDTDSLRKLAGLPSNVKNKIFGSIPGGKCYIQIFIDGKRESLKTNKNYKKYKLESINRNSFAFNLPDVNSEGTFNNARDKIGNIYKIYLIKGDNLRTSSSK